MDRNFTLPHNSPHNLFQELEILREVLYQALELDSTKMNLNLRDSCTKTGSQGMSDRRGITNNMRVT